MISYQISDKEKHLINEHVNLYKDKLMWAGHAPQQAVPSIAFFFVAAFVIILAIAGLLNYLPAIFFIIIFIYFYYHNSKKNMIYGITQRKVFWMQKGFKVKLNELPFSDIAKLDIVGRMDDPTLFTIYFTPNKTLNFNGYNYERQTSRPFPTFELIKNGDQVFQQLHILIVEYHKKHQN